MRDSAALRGGVFFADHESHLAANQRCHWWRWLNRTVGTPCPPYARIRIRLPWWPARNAYDGHPRM